MRHAPSFWHTPSRTSRLLAPLGWLYAIGGAVHRITSRTGRVQVPVISVGNVVAGGAGKTPTVITMTQLLRIAGFNPHILSRGYGGSLREPTRVLPDMHSTAQVGDEALLLARAAPTWIHRKRIHAATEAMAHGANVVICDDALQHHSLKKDINIVVIDGAYGLGNGQCIPAGPLREPLACALRRADAVVFIGDDKHFLRPRIPLSMPVFHADIVPVGDVGFLYEKPVIAFAGIARPQKFFTSLADLHVTPIATHIFPDHHPFTEEELRTLFTEATNKGARLVTTEKDWVRLPDAMRRHCHSLPIQLRFAKTEQVAEWLIERLYRCGVSPSSTH